MKLRQNFFLKKFLPVWGIIGTLYPIVMQFWCKGVFNLPMMIGTCITCAVFSATIAWNYFLTPDWIGLSFNMTGTFWTEAMIIIAILAEDDWRWAIIWSIYLIPVIILPVTLLIFFVNYLIKTFPIVCTIQISLKTS